MKCVHTQVSWIQDSAIEILREVLSKAEKQLMVYLVDEDCMVMVYLAKNRFYPCNFPFIYQDTTRKSHDMYKLRDMAA